MFNFVLYAMKKITVLQQPQHKIWKACLILSNFLFLLFLLTFENEGAAVVGINGGYLQKEFTMEDFQHGYYTVSPPHSFYDKGDLRFEIGPGAGQQTP